MRGLFFGWLFFSLQVGATALPAQPLTRSGPLGSDSIYSVSWPRETALAIALTGVAALPYLAPERFFIPRCPCPTAELSPLDRGAVKNSSAFARGAGDVLLATAVVGPAIHAFVQRGGINSAFMEDMAVFAQSLAWTAALASTAKVLAARPRPFVYRGDAALIQDPSSYSSFYSAHAALTTAALATAAYTYTVRKGSQSWPWLAVAGGGLLVGTARIAAGDHFPTDVLAGIAAGAAVGILVPWIYRRTSAPTSSLSVSLLPTPHGTQAVLAYAL